jgi:hypothetical protein
MLNAHDSKIETFIKMWELFESQDTDK